MAVADSRDYLILAGSKELLDIIKWRKDEEQIYPWTHEEWLLNKPIIEQYLEFMYKKTNEKINGK